MLPAAHCYNTKRLQECNYLQAMEGGIDSSHVSFLHSGDMHRDPLHRNTKGAHYQADQKPKFEIVESAGGLFIAARRNAEAGHYYWRITQWIMPWYTMVPPYGHNALNAHAWVPIDDETCFTWTFTYHPTRPLVGHGDRRHEKGRRHSCAAHSRHVPADHQQGQRLPDGPRGAEARRDLLRRARHRHAGRLGAGKHGADPGPLQGKSRVHRQRHHHGAAPPVEGGARDGEGRRAAGARSRTRSASARRPSCCRSTCRSPRPSATTSRCAKACRTPRSERSHGPTQGRARPARRRRAPAGRQDLRRHRRRPGHRPRRGEAARRRGRHHRRRRPRRGGRDADRGRAQGARRRGDEGAGRSRLAHRRARS